MTESRWKVPAPGSQELLNFPTESPHQRHKAPILVTLRDIPFAVARDQHQLLMIIPANRNDQPAAGVAQLLKKRCRHGRSGSGHENGVEPRELFPSQGSIAAVHM